MQRRNYSSYLQMIHNAINIAHILTTCLAPPVNLCFQRGRISDGETVIIALADI